MMTRQTFQITLLRDNRGVPYGRPYGTWLQAFFQPGVSQLLLTPGYHNDHPYGIGTCYWPIKADAAVGRVSPPTSYPRKPTAPVGRPTSYPRKPTAPVGRPTLHPHVPPTGWQANPLPAHPAHRLAGQPATGTSGPPVGRLTTHDSRPMKHLLLKFSLLSLCAALVSLAGCQQQQSSARAPGEKIRIVTTTGMIADAVENIAGEHADVVALMGPGVDPHLYKATHGDLDRLTEADIIFYNGLHLEGKMGEVFERLGRMKPVVAVANEVPQDKLRQVPGFQGAYDPHIWFDVKLWKEAVTAISDFLQEYDTAHRGDYRGRSEAYLQQLDSLDQAVRQSIEEIPEPQRVLITAHDAFGYFGDAYGIEVRGLQGISTLSEFGLRDVTELVNFIIARKIKAIFVETSVSSKSIEAVVEGCQKKNWNVEIGGNLFSDAMGAEGTPEGTYIGMVSANVRTIVESLK